MKQIALLSIIFSLVISCAVPIGTAFAFDEMQAEEVTTLSQDETAPEGEHKLFDSGYANQEEATLGEPPVVESKEAPTIDDTTNEGTDIPEEELPVIDEDPPSMTVADGIVISRVQTTGGTGKTDEELIELYNNADTAIDISGWCLESYKQSNPTSALQVGCITTPSGIGWRVFLPARTAYVYASSAFAVANKDSQGQDFIPDQVMVASVLNNDSGRIVLRNESGAVYDALTWGSGVELPIDQGVTRATISKVTYTLERRFDNSLLRYQDTNDNSSDFIADVARSVYVTGGVMEIYDACLNVVGIQATEGELFRDETTGQCSEAPPFINTCTGIVLAEVAANVDMQFIEVRNETGVTLPLGGCQLQTNRSAKTFVFSDEITLRAGDSFAVMITDTDLLLTKTTSGTVYLLSADGKSETDSVSYSGLAQETSWMRLDQGGWEQTYTITPAEHNIYTEYLPCSEGYTRNHETGRCNKDEESVALIDCGEGRERNPATGRCRNVLSIRSLVPCREGQYRSEETNRCRSIAMAAAQVLRPCAEGQFRNPETNRCKKIASSDDVALADCGEGRERNPLTNRCRNVIALTTSTGTLPFPVEKVEEGSKRFTSWAALSVVAIMGIGYGVWEWREEILREGRKLQQFISRSK